MWCTLIHTLSTVFIPCSGANETVTVILKPLVKGTMTSRGASVKYSYEATEEEDDVTDLDEDVEDDEGGLVPVQSYSTAPGRVEIIAPEMYARLTVNWTLHYTITATAAIVFLMYSWSHYTRAAGAGSDKKAK